MGPNREADDETSEKREIPSISADNGLQRSEKVYYERRVGGADPHAADGPDEVGGFGPTYFFKR